MKKSILVEPSQGDDFFIFYNGQKTKVSRYKFALYSSKFRELPEFVIGESSCRIRGSASFDTFREFLRGAQGQEVAITPANALDFLELCEFWRTETFAEKVKVLVAGDFNIEEAVKRIQKAKGGETTSHLESLVSENFDAALSLTSLAEFSVEDLMRIVSHPTTVIKRQQKYARLVIDMLNLYGSDASVLAAKINVSKLDRDLLLELLAHPKLIKSFIGDSLAEFTVELIKENVAQIDQVHEDRRILKVMAEKLDVLESAAKLVNPESDETARLLSKRIQALETRTKNVRGGHVDTSYLVERITQAEAKIAELSQATMQKASAECKAVETKAHKDLRKTNKIVNGLTKKSVAMESNISGLKNECATLKDRLSEISDRVKSCTDSMKSVKVQGSGKVRIVPVIDCPFAGQAYSGIISRLSERAQGNVHLKGMVKVTASTSDHNEPWQVVDFSWNDVFFTENKTNSWLMFDFLDKRVEVVHYTLRTHKYQTGQCHLKAWIIEGSNNGTIWDELDRRMTPMLNGPNKFQTFPTTKHDCHYRLIRLRQIGPNWRGDNVLALANMELFGIVYPQT